MGKDVMNKEVMITTNIVVGTIEIRKGTILKVRGTEDLGGLKYNLHGITYRMNARIELDITVDSDCFEFLPEKDY